MNQEIFERNLKAIGILADTWPSYLKERKYIVEENVDVISHLSKKGDTIFSVIKDGREYYLSGRYNPVKECSYKFNEVKKNVQICILIGVADGLYLRHFINNTKKDVQVIIYEPSINIFVKLLEEVDISDLIANRKIGFVVKGINEDEFKIILNKVLAVENYTLLHIEIMPNYERLYAEAVKNIIGVIRRKVETIVVNWNTAKRFTGVNEVNIIRNIKYLNSGYTMTKLKGICPPEVPCIVVAAGPSLNKNIHELKNAKGRACILACDTALKPLLNEGIIPDFFLVVDPGKKDVLFQHDKIADIPMVVSFNIPDRVMKNHAGKKFLYWDGSTLIEKAVIEAKGLKNRGATIEEILFPLVSGGSVATSAFSLADFMGSKTVILVGQDLAYTDDKSHADGTFKEKMETIDTSGRKYIEVEDINGNMVKTTKSLKLFRDWYEDVIKNKPWINVIDATEGGAKIHGAKIQTLKESIEEYCTKEFDLDGIIADIPKFLNEKEQERLNLYLERVAKSATVTIKKMNEGISLYNRLLKLSNKKIQQEQLSKLLKKIKKINMYLDKDEVALLAAGSLMHVEHSIRTGMYSYEDTLEDEMKVVAKEGVAYLHWQKAMTELLKTELDREFLGIGEKYVEPSC